MARFLLLLWSVAGSVALASCKSTIEAPDRVSIEVAVPCVKRAPERPVFRTEADLMNMPRGLRTLAVWSDLHKAEAYIAELEAVVEGCSRIK